MSFYLLKPCEGKSAFEAIPKNQIQIEIDKCINALKANDYEVIDAGIMLIAIKGDCEISVYPSAKLLLKCSSKEKAVEMANELYDVLGVSEGASGRV
ncbi:MAG: hypothetical protein JSV56_01385 [Methanomassiliicoccales archaeon]|nr:MAG: hypothetical protein JSV56_01385 [Methanomassiliicoccales archaeon]